jgi:hypothetical protein
MINEAKVMILGLGKSIYSPEQIQEFVRFQESQGTRRAFLAESAEHAHNGRTRREWGSGLTSVATDSLIDAVGYQLVPMYRVIGPTAAVALLVLFLVGILGKFLDIIIRAIAIARTRGCGWWLLSAFWGTIFQVGVGPFRWAAGEGHGLGKTVCRQMESEASRIEIEGRRQNCSTGLSNPPRQRSPQGSSTIWTGC